jgi:predicted ester cyclase
MKQSMNRHLRGFPDLHVTIDDILAEGQKVGVWYTVEGTHRGEFDGIAPTGKRVKWVGFDLFSVQDGKIAEARFLSDFHGLLTQLGASVSLPTSVR